MPRITGPSEGPVAVTGAAGYIGSHTVRQLVREGFRVVVVDSLINGKAQAVDPAEEDVGRASAGLRDPMKIAGVQHNQASGPGLGAVGSYSDSSAEAPSEGGYSCGSDLSDVD